jgi:SAM-dependent methyltransferase/uncharacterized protein YbaR (Trm112 family)
MNAEILRKLVCPKCSSPALANESLPAMENRHERASSDSLECKSCHNVYPCHDSIVDFADTVSIPKKLSSQWAMEFQPLVFIYEHIWRPAVTMPFSDLSWEIDTVQKLLDTAYGFDVLDLGCGPGNFARLFAQGVKPGVVIGFDLSLPMLRQGLSNLAKTNISNVTFLRGDVTRWPFAEASFDRVHCSGALHLFPELPQVFASIYNTVKPGGIFVCATYCRGGGSVKRQIQEYISSSYGFHWFELQELQDLAHEAGFVGWRHFIRKQGIVFRVNKPKMAA